jgi:hypothetical protein
MWAAGPAFGPALFFVGGSMSEEQLANGRNIPLPEIDGVKYYAAPESIDRMDELSEWLEDDAWARVERLRGRLDPQSYTERHNEVTDRVVARYFRFGNPGYDTFVSSWEGRVVMTWLRIRVNHPEVKYEKVRDWYGSLLAVEIENRLKAAAHDPNQPGGAVEASPSLAAPSAPSSSASPGTSAAKISAA